VNETSEQRARTAAEALESKQGRDVVILDVGDILSITEAFVIAHGTNTRQVRTLVDEIEARLAADCGVKPRGREGIHDSTWVVLDYGDIVVHVFLAETREYYALDRLWADAQRIEFGPSAAASG
jgi:ribosome-associated protein